MWCFNLVHHSFFWNTAILATQCSGIVCAQLLAPTSRCSLPVPALRECYHVAASVMARWDASVGRLHELPSRHGSVFVDGDLEKPKAGTWLQHVSQHVRFRCGDGGETNMRRVVVAGLQ